MLNAQIIWITWIGEHNIIQYFSFWISPAHKDTRQWQTRGGTLARTRTVHAHWRIHLDAMYQRKEPAWVIHGFPCNSTYTVCWSAPMFRCMTGCLCPLNAHRGRSSRSRQRLICVSSEKRTKYNISGLTCQAWHATEWLLNSHSGHVYKAGALSH